jgi:hypothetical protein
MALGLSIWQIFPFSPKHRFLRVHPKSEGKSLYLGKPLWELVPCVEVTLVSNFHSILCLVAQESRLGRKGSTLTKNCAKFWADRTSPGRFPHKSGIVSSGLVWIGFFSPTAVHCFSHILLSGCLIDFILFPPRSYL